MTLNRAIELLEIERECVSRNDGRSCDRDCGNCDLAQEADELLEMYDEAIKQLQRDLVMEDDLK